MKIRHPCTKPQNFLQQTDADQAVFLSSHLVRIWALPRAAQAGSTPPRRWADSRLRVQRARVRRHVRGPEEHMRCRYAENRKMSAKCGWIAFYDLFICSFGFNMPKAFLRELPVGMRGSLPATERPGEVNTFPWTLTLWFPHTGHTHTHTHKMHSTETQADDVIDCAIVLHLMCVKLLQLTQFCQMFDMGLVCLVCLHHSLSSGFWIRWESKQHNDLNGNSFHLCNLVERMKFVIFSCGCLTVLLFCSQDLFSGTCELMLIRLWVFKAVNQMNSGLVRYQTLMELWLTPAAAASERKGKKKHLCKIS